jgi:CBS-domain-containing membrane protein
MSELSHPWSRTAGLLLAALAVFLLDSQSSSWLHALVLPLVLAFAAWLMTRSAMAVAFATFALAAINTDLAATSWIPRIAYPVIATAALAVCLGIVTQRFRERIAATHEQRWAQRQQRVSEDTKQHQENTRVEP